MVQPLKMNDPSENPLVQTKPNIRYEKPGRSAFAQVLVTLLQSWLLLEKCLAVTVPTVVIGALHRNSAETLNMNDDQASWFGSLQSLFHPIGSVLSGIFQERFGRKGSMLLINVPILAAWLILAFAKSIPVLYVVAIILGLCNGLLEAPLHAYIGEVGEPHLRGTLSTISSSAGGIGFLVMFVLGYLFKWRTVAFICSAFPVITFMCMTLIPESPSWLIVRGRLEEARKSLCWLRGWVKPEEVEEEFKILVNYTRNSSKRSRLESVKSAQSHREKTVVKSDGYLKTELKTLTRRKVLLPLQMVFIVFTIMSTAALFGMRPYTINELKDLGAPVDSKLILIFAQVLFFVGNMVNVVFLRHFGKRKISLFSFTVSTAAIFGLGAYSFFLKDAIQHPVLVWIPEILLSIIYFLKGFGMLLLPWQLVCEVFPLEGRGTATGISAAWAHIVDFAMIKSFLYMKAWMSFSGVMCVYGACAVLGVVYVYFYLPETEGKTLEQIESYFAKDHDRKEKFSMIKSRNFANQ